MPRPVRVLLSVLALLLVLLGGALAWVTWFPDTLKRPLERALTASLGQEVRIEGPLVVHPGRATTVELHRPHVAAPAWARADDFLAIDRLRVGGDLWAYLRHGTISITELVVDAPRVALERNQEGQTSWPSGGGIREVWSACRDLSVGRIELNDGQIDSARRPLRPRSLRQYGSRARIGLKLDGTGKIGADPLQVALHVGSLEGLVEGEATLRADGAINLAATKLELNGQIAQPGSSSSVDLRLKLDSEDPSGLLALLGSPVGGRAPSLALSARLTGGAKKYAVEELHGQWGDSQLDADLPAGSGPRQTAARWIA